MESKRSIEWKLNSVLIVVLVFALQTVTGCTMAVLKLRKDHEAEVARVPQFRSIVEVRSGWIADDGTASACTEVKDAPEANPIEMAIRVSDARLIGATYSWLRSTPQRIFDHDGLPLYYYPLKHAEQSCEPPLQSASLPIHSLHLPANNQSPLSEIIRAPEFNNLGSPILFKITYTVDSDASPSSIRPVLLVFKPSSEASNPEPFGVPGVFEHGSEAVNPYTLLVPPAVLVDAAITIPLLLIMDKYCPKCF